jgi:hypothetical protein
LASRLVLRSRTTEVAIHHSSRLLALSFFLWCASPSPCLQPRPQSAPAAPSEPNVTAALIAGGATILVALITSVAAIFISRKTAKAALSLDDLLEEKVIGAVIAAIQDRRHFVSQDDILGALMMEYQHPDAWAQFRNLILDQSLVGQMVEKSLAEKKEIAKNIFGQLAPLLRSDSGAGPDEPGQTHGAQRKRRDPPRRGNS